MKVWLTPSPSMVVCKSDEGTGETAGLGGPLTWRPERKQVHNDIGFPEHVSPYGKYSKTY